MYQVEMDIELTFIPPMAERGAGITVTRRFELPFVPFEGLQLTGKAFSDHADPEGFNVRSVVWDEDRRVFLLDSCLISHDLPIPVIPDELRQWVERGWRLSSYRENYAEEDEDEPGGGEDEEAIRRTMPDDEWEELEKLPSMSPRSRPKEFNQLMKALVREMAEGFNNEGVAYAIDRTGRFFTDEQVKNTDTAATRKWRETVSVFHAISLEERMCWHKKVGKYPSISRFV